MLNEKEQKALLSMTFEHQCDNTNPHEGHVIDWEDTACWCKGIKDPFGPGEKGHFTTAAMYEIRISGASDGNNDEVNCSIPMGRGFYRAWEFYRNLCNAEYMRGSVRFVAIAGHFSREDVDRMVIDEHSWED
jgi:hypothetical protein